MSPNLMQLLTNGTLQQLAQELDKVQMNLVFEFGQITGYLHDPALPHDRKGIIRVSVEQIPLALENTEAFLAQHYGVTVDQYRRWKEVRLSGPQCGALTAQGRPCRSTTFTKADQVPDHPAHFDANKITFCATHQDHAANVRLTKPGH